MKYSKLNFKYVVMLLDVSICNQYSCAQVD